MPNTPIDTVSAFRLATDSAAPGALPERSHSLDTPKLINQRGAMLLSIARVAEWFGRSPRTVRWWLASGRLPVVRIGRTPFVPVEALDRMVDEALNGKFSEVNDINTGALNHENGK